MTTPRPDKPKPKPVRGLVLQLNRGEVVRIGDDIRIGMMPISSYCAKVVVEAPKHLLVLREELDKP